MKGKKKTKRKKEQEEQLHIIGIVYEERFSTVLTRVSLDALRDIVNMVKADARGCVTLTLERCSNDRVGAATLYIRARDSERDL